MALTESLLSRFTETEAGWSAPHFDSQVLARGPTVLERVLRLEPPRPPQPPMSVSSFSVASSN